MLTKAQAKYIQNLGHKKLRDDENVFVAEGPKLVQELLQSDTVKLHSLYADESFIQSNLSIKNHIEVSASELERISFLSTPNQVLGIFHKPVFNENLDLKDKISLMLDGIQDPGNLGSIVRIADWFGIGAIICSKDSADVFNPKVVQSTMGSIARVNVIYVELKEFIQANELPALYATTLQGKSIYEMEKINAGVIVIGNESKGISQEVLHLAKEKITIPKKGKAESLNAAVATGI
ncbi:MAG TPA: RNA methyltransferase, partial [Chitinophagaceae bacterium]|nr:RNA methyltransferase [Chitinophagaceae bacterium]